MNNTTDARRNTPAGTTAAIRSRLHQVRDSIVDGESSRERLRSEQAEHLVTALAHGATVREVVDAAGLSRAYLNRPGQPLASSTAATRASDRVTGLPEHAAARTGALEKSTQLRDRIKALKAAVTAAKAERVDLVAQLLEHEVDQTEIARDAGVSAEWIRRLAKAR